MPQRILLCDDELFVLRAAEIKFDRAGFDVRCAMDGEEAWAVIEQWRPDVVVTDCQMPRLDGLQLAKRIHDSPQFRALPVVMLTAKGFELSEAQIRDEFGVNLLFSKPFSPRALLSAVTSLLAGQDEISGDAMASPTTAAQEKIDSTRQPATS